MLFPARGAKRPSFRRQSGQITRQRRSRWAPFPEALEARQLLAQFTVTNTGDNGGVDPSPGDGTGTLRQAIIDSNNTPGSNSITFDIGSGGAATIAPLAALPLIMVPVSIDATTQPGFAGTPLVTLDGSSAGQFTAGLRIFAGGSTVRGLAIGHFGGNAAIELDSAGNRVAGNFVGVDASGTTGVSNPNFSDVVTVNGAANNTIGGTTAADRNVLAGDSGVWILGDGATGNLVEGNYIGTDVTGSVALSGFGVIILADGNTLANNVISGNSFSSGVEIRGKNNLLTGNFIGTDAAGSSPLGNHDFGVDLYGSGNTIGGTTAADRNIISANGQSGIGITGSTASGNVVEGNYIGTDATGAANLGNGVDGIILGSSNNTIGGTTAGAGNVISANAASGINVIEFPDQPTTGNLIEGNYLGTDATGTKPLGNHDSGVFFQETADATGGGNTVGGTTIEARNVISANGSGVGLIGTGGADVIEGNLIGTDVTGTSPLGNNFAGVYVASPDNMIGGTSTGAGNVIAFNKTQGVVVSYDSGDTGVNDAILGNSIFANSALGIKLTNGGNNMQSMPTLLAAVPDGSGGTNVVGTLSSAPNTTYRVELFANDAVDPSGFGQGQTYLGFVNVTTDGSGNAPISVDLPVAVPSSKFVSATATDPNGNTSEFGETIQPTATMPADLAVTLSAPDNTADLGTNVTYTVTLTNRGPEAATSAILADNLPAGLTFVSATSPDGTPTQANGTVSLTAGTLAVGGSVTMTITARADAIGTFTDTAAATADQPNALPVHDSASFMTDVVPASDLSVQIQADASAVAPGGTLTYTVVVTNKGPSPATGIYFDTFIPFGTTFVTASISQGTYQINPFSASDVESYQSDLAVGSSVTMTVTVTVPNTPGTITAEATAYGDQDDPNYSNNDVTLDTTVAPPGQFVFDSATYSATEGGAGNGTVTITVDRVGGSAGAATVDYNVAGGNAGSGVDYTGGSGTLSFADGRTSASFTVGIVNDTVAEPDETLDLALANPTGGATLGTPSTTELTIHSNEVAGTVQFASANVTVDQHTGFATITVTRTGGTASGVTVDYATADGTAHAGSDYTATSGVLVFAAGQSSLTFRVPVLVNPSAAPGSATVNLSLTIPALQGDPSDPGLPPTAGPLMHATLTIQQQPNVATLPDSVDGRNVTLVSPPGTTLLNVMALPAPADAPAGVTFPVGRFSFVVSGVAPGVPVTVSLILPSGVTVSGYEKYGATPDQPTPHWYAFNYDGTTGATISGNTVDLIFVDGQRGDSDLAVNGRVSDPGGPAFFANADQLTVQGATGSAKVGQPFSGVLGTFTDSNPFALAGSITVFISWGDGTTSMGTVRANGGTFTVSGTHTFSTPGAHYVRIKLTPQNGRITFLMQSTIIVTTGNPTGPAKLQGAALGAIVVKKKGDR